MAAPAPLSDEQIAQLQADVDAGGRPVVWFTPAAVGVDAGRSAKVVAVGEPAEGDFIQVRPAGSTDVLSFSPAELTLAKPLRPRRVASAPATAPAAADRSHTNVAPMNVARPDIAVPERPDRVVAPPQPERAPKVRPVQRGPVTVTMTSTPDGEWSVEVLTGTKRTVRARPVAASSVAKAARALGDEVMTAVDEALAAARERQRMKVERLQAELDAAQHALEELTA